MTLVPGSRLGPYEITASLGEGGMGVVYRATDPKLKREVAIKVLPEAFAADADRLARFEREAQLLAQLHHPNIASIFGLEESNGVRALVMELVEGEDLAERLKRGPLPVEEALAVARQIAEALEAAHEKGIVHRDLKPANVKLTADGKVKVLDFGLAKAMDSAAGATSAADAGRSPTLRSSPTLTVAGTKVGVILGTAAYMAPEQAKGQAVDKRADIWAFGVVLCEMLTGRRPFEGDSVPETLANVLKSEIDLGTLPAATPPRLRELVRRCLERDLKRRLRDIGEARIAIDEIDRPPAPASAAAVPAAGATPARRLPLPGSLLPLVLGLAAAAACGAVAAWLLLAPGAAAPEATLAPHDGLVRATIELPDTAPLALGTRISLVGFDSTVLDLSPDGRFLAYVGQAPTGTMLYLRELSNATVVPVAGTEGAISPFFSPDGRWLGFLTDDKVKKVALGGGAPVTICEAQTAVRGRWTRDDAIYFSTDYGLALWRVAAAGGRPSKFEKPDTSTSRFTDVSPDGRWLLRTDQARSISGDYASVSIVPVAGGPGRVVIASGYDARFLGERMLVFGRAAALHRVAFDPERGATEGEPQPVAAGVAMDSLFRQVQVAGSEQMIAYVPGGERAMGRLAWVDERGRIEYVDAPVALYGVPDLSDDGRRLAMHVGDVTDYVWIYDFARHEGRRLAVSESSGWPVWSPDGETLAVGTWRDSISDTRIVTQRAGGGAAREIAGPAARKNTHPSSWSPDGKVLAIGTLGADQEVSFAAAEGSPAPRPAATFTGHQPAFSPDGRWVAYISAESGQVEIFVRSYPDGETVRQVSTGGGLEPVWCRSGDLFYRNGNRWMSVRVRTQPDLQWDTPRLRFETDFVDTPGRSYDVSPDGTRLLVVKRATADIRNRIELVVNWQRPPRADAERLVPSASTGSGRP